jgi:hypothetical protein
MAIMNKDKSATPAGEAGSMPFPHFRETFDLQGQILEAYEQMSRAWLARMGSEAAASSELAMKLRNARSLPESLEIYTNCLSQMTQMAVEDGQHLFNDWQHVAQIITNTLSNGSAAGMRMAIRKSEKAANASRSSH